MSTAAAVALSLLGDALLAWWLLFRGASGARGEPEAVPRITLPAVLLVFVAGLAFVFAQAVALSSVIWRPFLGIHLLHSYVFLALPAFGALVACGWPRRATTAARATAAAGVLTLAAIGIDSSFIEPFALRTETASVPVSPARAGRAELVVAVLSDIQCDHVTDHERDAVARAMAGHPDLILLPGDLVQTFTEEAHELLVPQMHELLAPLDAPLGVYLVMGNCDVVEHARELLAGSRVQLLYNQVVERTLGDRRVTIGGVTLGFGTPEAHAVLARLAAPGGDDLRILCAHLPDVVMALPPGGRVDLVVAGHTHGGQVVLPWVGPLITLTSVPREVAGGGLHRLNDTPIYVSRGVGHELGDAPRVRFNCPPEVSLLTLRTAVGGDPAR